MLLTGQRLFIAGEKFIIKSVRAKKVPYPASVRKIFFASGVL